MPRAISILAIACYEAHLVMVDLLDQWGDNMAEFSIPIPPTET